MNDFVKSGLAPLDRQTGGFVRRRPYIVSGTPGTGKSCACLEFLDAGVQAGERGLLLTHDDPGDLLDSADFLGIDLGDALLNDRIILLTYQLDFVRRFNRAASPKMAFDELMRQIGDKPVQRVAIDSIVPFLEGGGAGSAAVFALVEFLDTLQATALLTYPGDFAGTYDHRLEPLLQRAGGVFHLAQSEHGRRSGSINIRKLRHQAASVAPVRYRIEPGFGYAQEGEPNVKDETLIEELRRRLLLLKLGAPLPDTLVAALEASFATTIRTHITPQLAESVREGLGVLVISVQRDTLDDALHLVRTLRASDIRTPTVLCTPFHLRGSDRTRALRAGADDFLAARIPESEFIQRLRSITRGGRSRAVMSSDQGIPLALQPMDDQGQYQLMDAVGFRSSVESVLTSVRDPFFTVVRLDPGQGDPARLAGLLVRLLRVDSGDFVGVTEQGVFMYLEGARPTDLDGLMGRINTEWEQLGGGALGIEAYAYPAESDQLLRALGLVTA